MRLSAVPVSIALVLGVFAAVQACGGSNNDNNNGDAGTSGGDSGQPGKDSGSGPGADGGGSDSSSGFVEAAHAAFPKVIWNQGAIVQTPKIVTVTFSNETNAAAYQAFGQAATTSTWWDALRPGLCEADKTTCVGDGVQGVSAALGSAPGASYTDSQDPTGPANQHTLQTYLTGLVKDAANKLPQPDLNTIYVFYLPATTTITLDGSKSCTDFLGYHNATPFGSGEMYYAIVPECAPYETGLNLVQQTTVDAAHEISETASDPAFDSFGFYLDLTDANTWGWNDMGGGEVADLCADLFGIPIDVTTVGSYAYQRVWSIPNAAAGKNPCVPIPPGEVYFNAAPQKGYIVLDVGKSETVEVDAFSDGPTSAWTLTAYDATDFQNPGNYLKFSIGGGAAAGSVNQQVNNGDKVQLTVTLVADPSNTQNGEGDALLVSSNGTFLGANPTATADHIWPFVVLTTAQAVDAGLTIQRGGGIVHQRTHQSRGPASRGFRPFGR